MGYCKDCRAIRRQTYNVVRNTDRARELKEEYRQWYISLKEGKSCSDCQIIHHHAALAWDHLPGFEKSANVSFLANRQVSKQRVLEEIKKCELVCANCHSIRTWQRRQTSP